MNNRKYEVPKAELNQMLHVDGKSIEEAAVHFGCSKRTIQKRMAEYDITFYPRRYDLDDDRLVSMYESDMTFMEIGAEFGVNWRTIYDRIKDRVEVRQQSPREGKFIGPDHWFWTGGVDQTESGYIRVRVDGEHKAQHRWIMEDIIGRELRTDEHVHHINGKQWDNRPSNLLLTTNTEHMKLHAAMRRDPQLDQRAWIAEYRASTKRAA